MILFWFYFSGLSNRIIRKKIVSGDWSQSNCYAVSTSVGNHSKFHRGSIDYTKQTDHRLIVDL